MATATQNGRTPTSARRGAEGASESAEFLIFEDNGGKYHWTLLDGEGK
jgi:hypothetical protein